MSVPYVTNSSLTPVALNIIDRVTQEKTLVLLQLLLHLKFMPWNKNICIVAEESCQCKIILITIYFGC